MSNSVGSAAAVLRALTASVSTPSLVAREKAKMWAREKMTPNFQIETNTKDTKAEDEKINDEILEDDADSSDSSDDNDPNAATGTTLDLKPKSAPNLTTMTHAKKDLNNADENDEEEDYLPLNNIVDWDEWAATGTYLPPKCKRKRTNHGANVKPASPKLRTRPGVGVRRVGSASNKSGKTAKAKEKATAEGKKRSSNSGHQTVVGADVGN